MRKVEKKKLLERITEYIGTKIQVKNLEGWTDRELYEQTGIPQNRLTEIKKFNKYKRPCSEKFLAAFVSGGIITVSELKEKIDMTEVEEAYIDEMEFYADKKLRRKIIQAQKLDIDVVGLLQAEIIRKEKK